MEINFIPLLPAAEVALTGVVVLLLDLVLKEEDKGILAWISGLGLAIAIGLAFLLWDSGAQAFQNSVRSDDFGVLFTVLCLGTALLIILSSWHHVEDARLKKGEFCSLVLFSSLGMVFMVTANDLLLFFFGLETMSLAVYVLTGMRRDRMESSEAAMKYFLNGAFASGFLLYGIALVYGGTGSTNLTAIAATLAQGGAQNSALLFIGALLLLVGLAFKVAAVPFHFWVPDAYDGAPTSVTAFMAVAVKAAAFAGWTRIFLHALAPAQPTDTPVLWLLAVMTMTLGNLLAIVQTSVKRMLAYSSIAHAGYLLIGVTVGGESGGAALIFYLLAYAMMTLGAFAVLMALQEPDNDHDQYTDFAGIGFRRPFLGMAMTVFMLSLAGFPPLGGFTGKFYLFRSAVASGEVALAIIGVLNSLLSVIYYLRVVVMMYMEEGGARGKSLAAAPALYTAVTLMVVGVILLGLVPAPALELTRLSFLSLGYP